MGQKKSTDRLPEDLRKQVFAMLENPSLTQAEIVEMINTKAQEKVVSRSSINRLAIHVRKEKEKELVNATHAEKSLLRIAKALERIANQLEKLKIFY
jgi:hypothetical protein